MRATISKLLAQVDVNDGLAIAGFAALLYGVALVSESAAWVVGGVASIAIGLWPSLQRRKG